MADISNKATLQESSGSSDDEEMESESETKVNSLMKQVADSPYEYSAHVQLISLLRDLNSVESLRDSRENMNKYFPLSPDLWLAWIQDENALAEDLVDKKRVLRLCERAVSEYLSVDVWLEYCQLSIALLADTDTDTQDVSVCGEAAVRAVYERAISAAGLHVSRGSLVWHAYRELELALAPDLTSTQESEKTRGEQFVDRITTLYRRQLRVPHSDHASTWHNYEQWCQQHALPAPCSNARRDYDQAGSRLPDLLKLEQQLEECASDADTCHVYQQYVRHELQTGTPARVVHVLERAVSAVCLSGELWLMYGRYMDWQLRPEHALRLGVYERAVRNVPWLAGVWQHYMWAAERADKSAAFVQDLVSRSLSSGFQTSTDYLAVWLSWLEFTHRRLLKQHRQQQQHGNNNNNNNKQEDKETNQQTTDTDTDTDNRHRQNQQTQTKVQNNKDIDSSSAVGVEDEVVSDGGDIVDESCLLEAIRPQFEKACQHLAELFGVQGDPECCLLQYWASLEAAGGQMQRAHQLWSDILSQGHDKHAVMWQQYVLLVWREANDKQTRRVLRQAMERTVDWPETILALWTSFERQSATSSIDSWDDMNYRYRVRMKRVEELRAKQTEKSTDARDASVSQQSGTTNKKHLRAKQHKTALPASRASGDTKSENGAGSSERHSSHAASDKDDAVFKTPSLPPPPPGYHAAKKRSLEQQQQQQQHTSEDAPPSSKKAKIDGRTEALVSGGDSLERRARTVFVSNLHFSADEQQLRQLFSSGGCAQLIDVRLVKDYRGRSKGFAYVEMACKDDVETALKLDRTLIDGRPCFISRFRNNNNNNTNTASSSAGDNNSDVSGSSTDTDAFKYSCQLEKNKLFVRGLASTVTSDDLRSLFEKHGHLTAVRVVTYRNGHSKGIAYVEFDKARSASEAVVATDQTLLHDRTISVAISDPPGRGAPLATAEHKQQQRQRSQQAPAGTFLSGRGRRGRLQVSFMPRVVRATAANSTHPPPTTSTTAAPTKSNEQFRQLLNK